jgi:hypothetical protein
MSQRSPHTRKHTGPAQGRVALPAGTRTEAVRLGPALHLAELPGEIRQRLLSHSRCPAELTRVAAALQDAVDTVRGDASSEELRAAATRIAADVAYAQRILARLTSFSGELGGLAWVVDLREVMSNYEGGGAHEVHDADDPWHGEGTS